MIQAEFDALSQNRGQIMLNLARNVLTQNITTQWQWQTGPFFPPFAQIDYFCKTGLRIGELPFVDDQASRCTTAPYRLEDLVERHDEVFKFTEIKLQGQERARHRPWHRDYPITQALSNIVIWCSVLDACHAVAFAAGG